MQNQFLKILNKQILGILFAFMSVAIFSCSKTSDTTVSPNAVAFENTTMKPWFDTNCGSCHLQGKSDYKKWLYNPADYDGSIKKYIASLYSEVYVKKTMPDKTKLSTTELAKFKTWYDAGYPAK